MKQPINRRGFLGKTALAGAGLAFITSTNSLFAFSNNNSPFKGYNPFAEEKNDLRTNPFGKHITISGKIYDAQGESTLSNAKVEVWHLSPNSKKFRHQAKLKTDEQGRYSFITDIPAVGDNKTRKIFFKVSNKDHVYFTQLYVLERTASFNSTHWEDNQSLGKKLATKTVNGHNKMTVEFNISLKN